MGYLWMPERTVHSNETKSAPRGRGDGLDDFVQATAHSYPPQRNLQERAVFLGFSLAIFALLPQQATVGPGAKKEVLRNCEAVAEHLGLHEPFS